MEKDLTVREEKMKNDYDAKMNEKEKEIQALKSNQSLLTSQLDTIAKKDLNYKTVSPILVGTYFYNKKTLTFHMEKHIPSLTTEVLVNVFLYSGENEPERTISSNMKIGDKSYTLYLHTYGQDAYAFDNNIMWIPVDKSKAISFTSGYRGNNCRAHVYIIGHR